MSSFLYINTIDEVINEHILNNNTTNTTNNNDDYNDLPKDSIEISLEDALKLQESNQFIRKRK